MGNFVKHYTYLLIFFFLPLLIGYLLSTLIWNHISLPFSNEYFAVGKLALEKFNPINNYLRWAIFIILPSLIFLTLYVTPAFKKLKNLLPKNLSEPSQIEYKVFKPLILLFTLSLITGFLSKSWSTQAFDMFHEGEQLTPALNYVSTAGIWTSSFFVHGALYDVFTAVLGWNLFGQQTIGSYRVAVNLLNLFNMLAFSLFIYTIFIFFDKRKTGVLIAGTILVFYLATTRIQNLDRRALPLLLILLTILFAIKYNKKLLYFVSGFLAFLSLFYTLDIGLFSILLVLSVPIILKIYGQKASPVVSIIGGIIAGGALMFAVLGKTETLAFLSNFAYFIGTKDLIDSYIYPFPNIFTNFRFTLPLILNALNIMTLVYMYLIKYQKDSDKKLAIFHTIIIFISTLYFRSALGRSDLTHIEYGSSLIFVAFGASLSILFLSFVDSKKLVDLTRSAVLVLSAIFIVHSLGTNLNFKNIYSFYSRTLAYAQTSDLEYINSERQRGIVRLRQIFSNEPCVLNLTSEASLPYLIKKPSCGSVYISYFASAEPLRTQFLNQIKNADPQYLIYSSKLWVNNLDNITNHQRFPTIMNYVDQNYEFYELVSDYWVVYKKSV